MSLAVSVFHPLGRLWMFHTLLTDTPVAAAVYFTTQDLFRFILADFSFSKKTLTLFIILGILAILCSYTVTVKNFAYFVLPTSKN